MEGSITVLCVQPAGILLEEEEEVGSKNVNEEKTCVQRLKAALMQLISQKAMVVSVTHCLQV